jgi:hypothetical protein
MALTYKDLLDIQTKLSVDNDPEFRFKFISNNPLIPAGTEWKNMYLLPTIGINNDPGEIRVDFAVGENLQKRISNHGNQTDHEGAFILLTNSENSDIFLLDDQDGEYNDLGLSKEIYDAVTNARKSGNPLQVNIERVRVGGKKMKCKTYRKRKNRKSRRKRSSRRYRK